MAPNDDLRTPEEARRSAGRPAGAAAYPPPHQNGTNASFLNPFHLAIAELQADAEFLEAEAEAPQPAPVEAPRARRTVILTQPVRALGIGSWVGIGALAVALGLVGGALSRGFRGGERPPALDSAVVQGYEKKIAGLERRAAEADARADSERAQSSAARARAETMVRGLEGSLAELEQKVAGLPTSLDLKGLVDKEVGAGLAPVSGRLNDAESSAGGLSDAVKELRRELNGLRGKLETMENRTAAARVPPPAPDAARRDDRIPRDPSFTQGAEFFKKGRYKEALAVFNKLELSNPDDARVWYFGGLSLGMLTGEWEGGARERVSQGLARERAGTPDSSQINAAFKDLTAHTGKDWLEAYRKYARDRPVTSNTP